MSTSNHSEQQPLNRKLNFDDKKFSEKFSQTEPIMMKLSPRKVSEQERSLLARLDLNSTITTPPATTRDLNLVPGAPKRENKNNKFLTKQLRISLGNANDRVEELLLIVEHNRTIERNQKMLLQMRAEHIQDVRLMYNNLRAEADRLSLQNDLLLRRLEQQEGLEQEVCMEYDSC